MQEVRSLRWGLEHRGDGRIEVREDATRLHCHCSPLTARLTVHATGSGRTSLTIEGSVPGWGPVASQHVRSQTDLLARRIGLAAIRAGTSYPPVV